MSIVFHVMGKANTLSGFEEKKRTNDKCAQFI